MNDDQPPEAYETPTVEDVPLSAGTAESAVGAVAPPGSDPDLGVPR